MRANLLSTGLFALFALLVFGFLPACAESDEPMPAVSVEEEALKGGCRWDCPKCVPNKPCSRRACILVCPPNTTPCGDTVCRNGDVCCNASCGICTPPDGFCTQQACEPAPSPSAECTSDADCVAQSDYCGGCNCYARAHDEPVPLCAEGDQVSCFQDPCANQTAVCNAGTCELAATQ